MAKGYKENEQAFSVGDVAKLDDRFEVKIISVFKDEDNSFWYEVELVPESLFYKAFTREVIQSRLEIFKEVI